MNGTPASDANVRLHDYWRSSAAYRVRIALNLKGIAYESMPVDLAEGEQRDPDYLALNPQGFVPMLEIDGLRLGQTLAIMDYLDARVEEPPFVPKDAAARAKVLAMALVIACDVHPVNNLRVLNRLADRFGADEEAKAEWVRHWNGEGLAPLEAMARERDGRFLSGANPGIADICLVPQLYNARRFKTPLDAYPTLVALDAELQAMAPIAAAHPDQVRPA